MKLRLVNILFLVGIFSLFLNHSLPDRQSSAAKIALNNDQMSLIEGKGCSTLAAVGAVAGTIGCILTWFEPWGCAAAAAADIDCLLPDGSSGAQSSGTGGPAINQSGDGNPPVPTVQKGVPIN